MEKKVLNEMFDNLLHIGNKTGFWNSKMKDYIYGSINGIHVINLVKTVEKLEKIKEELKNQASEGKKILFVATKLQARDAFAKLAKETGHFYVTEKWVPGLLTNFKTIKGRISTYLKLLRDSETGVLDILTKKEKAAKLLELDKLDKAFKGLKEMKKIPDLIFVVDSIYEKQSVKEANNLNIPVYSIVSTNGDYSDVADLIPANTNSVKSLEYLANSLKESLSGIKLKATLSTNKTLTNRTNVIKKVITTKTIDESKNLNNEKAKVKETKEVKPKVEKAKVEEIKEVKPKVEK